jgi:predicted RecA/RadA family phage recombinase
MQARYVQRGETIDYTPTADTLAGTVVVIGQIVGVTKLDLKAGEFGGLATVGVFEIEKDTTAIPFGSPVYLKEGKASVSADNGQTGGGKVEYPKIGVAIQAAVTTDHLAIVKIG